MYSPHQPVSALGGGTMDGSGTINPAALEASAIISHPTSIDLGPSPRGLKRSRTPDEFDESTAPDGLDDDDSKPRKRGRPPRGKGAESPTATTPTGTQTTPAPLQTPQLKAQSLPQASPPQASPPKSAASGSKVKALPTVRDHTTDQLNETGDEYLPREWDEQGEKKVEETGHLRDGREYRCRIFLVPNRGNKLFMLATECARVLNYRDSYLLFNKNRSLYKIIASQTEKDDLIHQDILPYSYRSRQIAIVTAKSMYRQFGSRLIVNGRRVRDDYWESKARKQGFTEDDPAGEKRPGATKQKEEAAAQASSTNANAMNTLAHGEIVYRNGPGINDQIMQANSLGLGGLVPTSLSSIPMINLAPTDDPRAREYGNVQRPRHEILGTSPYQDRSQPSSTAEIVGHAAQAAEFNKGLTQIRQHRNRYHEEQWKREHPPINLPDQQTAGEIEDVSQNYQSPPNRSVQAMAGMGQQQMISHQQPGQPQMMTPQAFAQQQQHQQQMAQSPMRASMHQQMRPEQMYQRQQSVNFPSGPGQSPQQYGMPQNQMWPPPQPQQSPHPQQHNMQQFHPQQGSPLQQQPPPQMLSQHQNAASLQQMYQNMGGMPAAAYQNMAARGMFQGSPGQAQQFMNPSAAGQQQPGMQGWTTTTNPGQGQPNWHGF